MFQACIPLALVLTFFCTPVFSVSSLNEFGTGYLATTVSSAPSFPLRFCFESNSSVCLIASTDVLTITFPYAVNLSNLILTSIHDNYLYSHFVVNDEFRYVRSHNPNSKDLQVSYSSIDGVYKLVFYPLEGKDFGFRRIFFNFDYVDFEPVSDFFGNDITDGIDWLLFSYAFIIVGFSSMLGRAIKSIFDLIKYG